MDSVALDTADLDLADLVSRVERGEHIVLTRAGAPVADLMPRLHPTVKRLDLAAGAAYLRAKGIEKPFPFVADDFDAPLPEDFLLRPLSEA